MPTEAEDTSQPVAEQQSLLPILSAPADGLPGVVQTAAAMSQMTAALARGQGPVALDVERAQSYRYSNKAYLVQLRRPGAGTFLVDPIAFEEAGLPAQLSELSEVISAEQWLLHAATQDLPNLVQLGLRPSQLFDTELAGRLLGLPKVSLGAMAEQFCGVRLLKEHSAADWSRRPVPDDWLSYAALDVELLHELHDRLSNELQQAGKQEWARQEFDWLCRWAMRRPPEQPDRWRRTTGTHQVHTARGLAVVRELWLARDQIAQTVDKAPSKIVPDVAITELAALVTRQHPKVPNFRQLQSVAGFRRRGARQYQDVWVETLHRVAELPTAQLPPLRAITHTIPPPRHWQRSNPDAWSRWQLVRPEVVSLAEDLRVPVENLIAPDALRQLLWQPTQPVTETTVAAQLTSYDARSWQVELVAPLVVELLG